MLSNAVFDKLAKGGKANWLCSIQYKHSFTYTPDAAKATALLGNTDEAYNQVWHVPTSHELFTGKEWIDTIAAEFGVKPRIQVAPGFMIRFMGLFNPIMNELVEMLYQYDRDYVFDSSKFEKKFDFKPTPYREGIKQTIVSDYK
jgi:nucleoside-diphosphate-sugar epimerase